MGGKIMGSKSGDLIRNTIIIVLSSIIYGILLVVVIIQVLKLRIKQCFY